MEALFIIPDKLVQAEGTQGHGLMSFSLASADKSSTENTVMLI